jgi:chromosome segregation ATPase
LNLFSPLSVDGCKPHCTFNLNKRHLSSFLLSSAFDLEREREWRQRENKLKVQIAQLEATIKADLGEKGGIIDKYANIRDAHEKLEQEHRELQITHFTMKEQYDDLNEKLKFFTKVRWIPLPVCCC